IGLNGAKACKSKRLRCYSRLPISVSPREIPRGDAARDECPHRFAVLPSLGFPVNRVLPIVTAELLELQLLRHRLLVLGRRVIPTFALGALKGDDFSACACHWSTPLEIEN